MSAIPYPKLWTPWTRPSRPALRDRRSWLRRLIDPIAAYATGDVMLDSSGNVMLDSSGNVLLDGGSQSCCLYQARLCSDNSLAGVYVKKSQFPSFPSTYYFKTSGGTCMYAQSSDAAPCDSTPLVTGETAVASCSDSACTLCPDGTGLSTTYTITGWNGTFPDANDIFWCGNPCTGAVPSALVATKITPGSPGPTAEWSYTTPCVTGCCGGSGAAWTIPINGTGCATLAGGGIRICDVNDFGGPYYGKWELSVVLDYHVTDSPFTYTVAWVGYKPNSADPTGTYTLDTSRSSPSSAWPPGFAGWTPSSMSVS